MRWISLLLVLFLAACSKHHYPHQPFDESDVPPAPDYANPDAWTALPQRDDTADSIPSPGLREAEATAVADVFFIHPTTYNSDESWNASLTDSVINHETDWWPIRHQASAFNESCRVFAPRYRQATFGAFFQDDLASRQASIQLAYADVKAAFEYYLANENHGRPIIVASHSQGTVHAIHLMKEFFDGKPLADQLVAAYLVGWTVKEGDFALLKPCADPTQTNCFVSWCTWAWGCEENQEWFENAIAVNPVTWRLDSAPSAQAEHQGMVLRKFDKIMPAMVEVKVHEGRVWVTKPDLPGKFLIRTKNYHVADYNIFWMDVRANVRQRVNAWVSSHPE